MLLLFWGACEKKSCPLGQKYVDNQCKCRVNSNCPTGQVCRKGKCLKEVKRSTCPHVPCAKGRVCRDGVCGPCKEDGECKKGKFCDKGRCKPLGKECSPDRDCPLGQKCVHGYCVKDTGPVPLCKGERCTPPCVLKPLFFHYKGSRLTPKMTAILKENLICLRKAVKGGRKTIHLAGMADPRGPSTYNDDLSALRLKAVVDELTMLDPSLVNRLEITREPLGETCATGNDEASWRKDRKVVFVWFKKDGQVCP